MTMQPLDKSRYDDWDRFVYKVKEGTIFHTAWWHRSWGVDFDIYARTGENGEIEAGMPVYISGFKHMPRFLDVKGVTKPPLTVVNGPLFKDSTKTGRSSRYTHVKKELLCAINSLPDAGYYDIFLGHSQDDVMPYLWNGFDDQVLYTYVIRKEDAGAWRDNISSNTRRFLKAAHKEADALGCVMETDTSIDEIIPVFLETAKLKGYSAGLERFIDRLPAWWAAVREKNAGRIYVLRCRDGEAMCTALAVWDAHSVYSLIGGTLPRARGLSNMNMLLFERMITDAFEMGLDFDFEGSSLMGVESFVRRWGGELRHYFRVTKIRSGLLYAAWKGYQYLKFHRKPLGQVAAHKQTVGSTAGGGDD